MKLCNHCLIETNDFRKSKGKRDGLDSWCIPCRKLQAKEFYKNNKAKINEKCRDYRAKDPKKWSEIKKKSYYSDHKRTKTRQRLSRQKNSVTINEGARQRYILNKDHINERKAQSRYKILYGEFGEAYRLYIKLDKETRNG